MDKRAIYVVEDDPFQAEWIIELLQQKFGDWLEVKPITTQYGFETAFETLAADQPVAIILDVMLQWKDTDIAKEPAKLDSFRRAGLDCWNMLAKDPRTRKIPVMLYSVLDRATVRGLPPGIEYLRKDSNDRELIAWLKGVLAAASAPQV
jgi:CheY-like chemotaxis protein